ncbi:hypothetical protein [Sphaerisporangium rhizosphaerae]|uniref:Uncharacterized protein n=1 Tax=Sphaerisporangium rhizosphaerae TaxID=2269375 RepID=A0ABW2PGW6_9ACTN
MEKPTMTEAQALARVEQLINETVSALRPKPRLEVDPTSLRNGPCGNSVDSGSKGRIIVGRNYYLREIPKDQINAVALQVREYWKQRGYVIEGVSKTGKTIAARSTPDDFLLALDAVGDDGLGLGASSICVWPNGTPEPTSNP